jgi:hypothetical protein
MNSRKEVETEEVDDVSYKGPRRGKLFPKRVVRKFHKPGKIFL